MCITCGGSKVVYKVKGSMMLSGPCPACNPKFQTRKAV